MKMKLKMKRQNVTDAVIVALALLLGVAIPLDASGETSPEVRLGSREWERLEASWENQAPVVYYAWVNNCVDEIRTNAMSGADKVRATRLLDHVLSKGLGTKEGVVLEDLVVLEELMSLSVGTLGTASEEECRMTVVWLATCLKSINAAYIEGYEPKAVYMNISPPYVAPGYGRPVMAGMNPEGITNSVMKAKYKEAIQENKRNNDENKRQSKLKELQWRWRKLLLTHMETFAATGNLPPDVIKIGAEAAGVSEDAIRDGSAYRRGR